MKLFEALTLRKALQNQLAQLISPRNSTFEYPEDEKPGFDFKPPSGWKSESFIGIGHNHQGRMQMASVRYTAVLEPAEEGGFVVKCVELPVATEGETKEEALANLKEAIEGYLEVKAERLREQTKGERVEVIVEAPSALMA